MLFFQLFKKITNNKHKCKDKDIRGKKTCVAKHLLLFLFFMVRIFILTYLLTAMKRTKKITLNTRDFCERFVTFSFFILEKKAKVL